MNQKEAADKEPLSKLNGILTGVIVCLLLVIILGTGISFITKKAVPGKDLRTAEPVPSSQELKSLNKNSAHNLAAYTGIGTLRAATGSSDDNSSPVAVVITPWLSYFDDDPVFYEEISRKRLLISGIITGYFSEHTKNQLMKTGEEKIKAELLELINARLSLGKIENIYFTDYIFLE